MWGSFVNDKNGLLKDIELRLISELMKNSRRSDRQLSKVLSVSQPTVTRTKSKLEKEGYIKEYTIIPDFVRLGFQLASFILVKIRAGLSPEEREKARQISINDMMEKASDEVVFLDTGIGDGYTGIVVSLHRNYSDYTRLVSMLKDYPFVDTSATLSFIVNLNHKNQFRNFTFSTLAKYLLTKASESQDSVSIER